MQDEANKDVGIKLEFLLWALIVFYALLVLALNYQSL